MLESPLLSLSACVCVWAYHRFLSGFPCASQLERSFLWRHPMSEHRTLCTGWGRFPRQSEPVQGLSWPGTGRPAVRQSRAAFLLKQLHGIPREMTSVWIINWGSWHLWGSEAADAYPCWALLLQTLYVAVQLHGRVCLRHVLFCIGSHADTRLGAACSVK